MLLSKEELEASLDGRLSQDIVDAIHKNLQRREWLKHVVQDKYAYFVPPTKRWREARFPVFLPPPDANNLINVNMMPFLLFDIDKSLPEHLMKFKDTIKALRISPYVTNVPSGSTFHKKSPRNNVAYLTVHESLMDHSKPQRRPGLHVERPGSVVTDNGGRIVGKDFAAFRARYHTNERTEEDDVLSEIMWGLGHWDEDKGAPVDGIWMCSNVAGTCAVYDATIEDPQDVTDDHGGIEHLREIMEQKGCTRRLLGANEMCWITDRTPHESLPLPSEVTQPVIRQFFRVVVGRITIWYSKHNTPNPLGIQTDAVVSDADKFDATRAMM